MNKWIAHIKETQKRNPGMSYKDAMKAAKKTYVKQQLMIRIKDSGASAPGKAGSKALMIRQQKGRGKEHARFSSEIYKEPNKREDVQNYIYMGGDAEKGYWKKNGEIIIAFRGTVNKNDVKTDLMLSTGLLHKTDRYKRDIAYTRNILKNAYDPASRVNVVLTGHSLGGAIATEIGRELGLKVWAYNPGASIKENVRGKTDKIACLINPKGKKCKKANLINIERTIGDPVSYLGRKTLKTKLIIPKKINIHSIDNFEML